MDAAKLLTLILALSLSSAMAQVPDAVPKGCDQLVRGYVETPPHGQLMFCEKVTEMFCGDRIVYIARFYSHVYRAFFALSVDWEVYCCAEKGDVFYWEGETDWR